MVRSRMSIESNSHLCSDKEIKGGKMKAIKVVLCMFAGIIVMAVLLVTVVKPQSASDGKTVFDAKCAMCHAKDGKGNPAVKGMAGGDLAKLNLVDEGTSKLTDGDLINTINNGKNKMPAYKGKLTDVQINSIVKYIRTLQGK